MKDPKRELIEEVNKHKGEFVISRIDHKVKRLIGLIDLSIDYCYLMWDGNNLFFDTCCAGFIPLKDCISDKDYNYFERIYNLNAYDTIANGESKEKVIKYIKDSLENDGAVLLTSVMNKISKGPDENIKKIVDENFWDLI